jgi:hypothetical protein
LLICQAATIEAFGLRVSLSHEYFP